MSASGYRPFGLPQEGEGGEPYGYSGEWWEDDAGLLFLRARYYQPVTGRFLSQDTWRGNVWWPAALHRFVYARNNPVRHIDPTGHTEFDPGASGDLREWELYGVNRDWHCYLNPENPRCQVDQWEVFGFAVVGLAATAIAAAEVSALAADVSIETIIGRIILEAQLRPTETLIAKAVLEELAEAVITGTPFDPNMVVLDFATQGLDDMVPRKTSCDPDTERIVKNVGDYGGAEDVPIRYAPPESGIPRDLQDAIVKGMRETNVDYTAVRRMTPGSEQNWAGRFPAKPEGAKTLPGGQIVDAYGRDTGLRRIELSDGTRTIVRTDLDPAWAIRNGQGIPDDVFMDPDVGVGPAVNRNYRGLDDPIVQHGTHTNGVLDPEIRARGAHPRYLTHLVDVFGPDGYIETGPMRQMYQKYRLGR